MTYPQDGSQDGPQNSGGYQPPQGQPPGGAPGYGPQQGGPGPVPPPGGQPQPYGGPQQQGPGGQGSSDEGTMALLSHLGGIVLGFVAPLIIWLIKKDESAYVRHHSLEALNFQIMVTIGYVICSALTVVIIGAVLLPILWVVAIVFSIMGAMASQRGEWYRYPFSIRMVS